MEIRTRRQDDCWIVELVGSADVTAADQLRQVLAGLVEAEAPKLVCDLSRTDFICSEALGVLITAHLKAAGRRGLMRLAAPQKRLRELLETTRLDRLFAVYPDVPGAMKA